MLKHNAWDSVKRGLGNIQQAWYILRRLLGLSRVSEVEFVASLSDLKDGSSLQKLPQLTTKVVSYPLANGLLILLCSPRRSCLKTITTWLELKIQAKRADTICSDSLSLLALTAVDLRSSLRLILSPLCIWQTLDLPPSPRQLTLQTLGFFWVDNLSRYLIQSLVLLMATKPYDTVEEHPAGVNIIQKLSWTFRRPNCLDAWRYGYRGIVQVDIRVSPNNLKV